MPKRRKLPVSRNIPTPGPAGWKKPLAVAIRRALPRARLRPVTPPLIDEGTVHYDTWRFGAAPLGKWPFWLRVRLALGRLRRRIGL